MGDVAYRTPGRAVFVADAFRHRALLDYAAECEAEAWHASDSARAATLYEEALHARLAALALERVDL